MVSNEAALANISYTFLLNLCCLCCNNVLKYTEMFGDLIGKVPVLNVSYKPQKISPKSQGTVRQMLHEKIRDSYIHPQFITDVIKPLQVEQLYDQEVCIIRFY